jgi:hypothetical protein
LPGRREPRFQSSLAVLMEDGKGRARNVSASGIYFETDLPFTQGADLKFTVHFAPAEGGPLRMKCRARVVRIDDLHGLFGVGAAIQDFSCEREERRP